MSVIFPSDYKLYTVKKNDTLYSIARKFKVTVNEIHRQDSRNTKALFVGEKIKINIAVKNKKFIFPTQKKPEVIRKFSSSPVYPYKGILLKNVKSTVVVASDHGTVLAIDFLKGYENYIIVNHLNGFATVYGNLEKIFVKKGQTVDKREKLGNYYHEKGLYFQVNLNQEPVNPLVYIK